MHDINDICVEKITSLRKDLDEHISSSPEFRDKTVRHDSQIITLEKAHEATMADIREIKSEMKEIRSDIAGLKIYILTSAVAGLMIICGIALWLGGDKKQIEVNTHRLDKIEAAINK